MQNRMKAESIESMGDRMMETAEDLKTQSEAVLKEGGRLLRRAQREIKDEFERHPIAMIVAGAAVVGALVWLIAKK